ncbi:MAG: F420-dependent NADP oxidoreductase [Bacteroidetes bacterium]|nr:MAG: F420-dependent NADP oxidoreductase [Bacteroidota bacterium]
MKIGIIGTGKVARALGKALGRNRYHLMFGSRDPQKAKALGAEIEHYGEGGSIANAIHYGEVVVLAVPFKAIESIARATDNFQNKIVIDPTNPLIFASTMADLAIGHNTSAAEQVAKMLPGAKVVKAFNTAFAHHIEQGPYFGPNDASMFYCGDDEGAKKSVRKIIEDVGFEPVDAGPLTSARMLEPMAALLLRLSNGMGMGNEIAFKLLTR